MTGDAVSTRLMRALGAAALAWTGVAASSSAPHEAADALLRNEADGRDWPAYGRLYDEQHYSPLGQINEATVKHLGLVWSRDLPATNNPTTAPVEVGGIIYMSYGYSVVHAIDAVTGRQLWTYDTKTPEASGKKLRFGWGIRGIAWWDGIVITATHDGRLVALDGRTGKLRWSVTTTDKDDIRYITGAPRVFDGKVIIGHGGADTGITRGYVTAYDARTGRQLWRFFAVPGNPTDGFENEAMAMAAKTWTGEWWKGGGGGTVWNAITYDPKFDRIYIGCGNGAPWNEKARSPGGGDNLFLTAIVALDAKTGKYIWHYQTTPGDTWDYGAAMDITLADLVIDGRKRPVLMQAPKNGFLYVIDRETGKLISAEKFVPHVNWAERIDLATGRPVANPDARYPDGEAVLWPSMMGAHGLPPQSFHPGLGLLFIPTLDQPLKYSDKGIDLPHWKPIAIGRDPAVRIGPADPANEAMAEGAALVAWNPVTQKQDWKVSLPGRANAGTMATGGNLVFQGRSDGQFVAYAGATGKVLWKYDAGVGIAAQPITFERKGRQYVTVVAGFGGGAGVSMQAPRFGWDYRQQKRRLLTFALGGKARLAPSGPVHVAPYKVDGETIDTALVGRGAGVYYGNCVACHGGGVMAGGSAPDLRASPIPADRDAFAQVVRGGALMPAGMPVFSEMKDADLDALRQFIRAQAAK